jgi:hypothetical protein
MGKAETRLTTHMVKDGKAVYGERIVIVKYHGNEYSRAGVTDLLGCLDGAFFACEVKAPESYGGSVERALSDGPTTLQKAFIGHVLAANGTAWVAATRQQFLDGLAALDAQNRANCYHCEDHADGGYWCHLHPKTEPAIV